MEKIVELKLHSNAEEGVRVTLVISPKGKAAQSSVLGDLPSETKVVECYQAWEADYRRLGQPTRVITPTKITVDGSLKRRQQACHRSAQTLRKQLNVWLQAPGLQRIRETWLAQVRPAELTQVLISTDIPQLKRLPWSVWDLLEERYPQAEIALSAPTYQLPTAQPRGARGDQVRILAVLGNSQGIDVETDRQQLDNLPHAQVTLLLEPNREVLNHQLWEEPWDILFFAGHSQTEGETGRIYLNQDDSLTLDELRYGLRKAIHNGLQLAIFNSCDGLGLAKALEQLHLPELIVMREPVPDPVAQAFLNYFLRAFSGGASLYAAVREAREKLQGLEGEVPGASWLPVICQNPAVQPPHWQAMAHVPLGREAVDASQPGDISSSPAPPGPVRSEGTVSGKTTGQRVFISYRAASPDKDLAKAFHDALATVGHQPFMSGESIKLVGEAWQGRIHRELQQCDYFLLFLSEGSATSEMVTEEVKQAQRLQEQTGGERPILMPIRVNFSLQAPLNYELRSYLDGIQQREWQSQADTERLLGEVLALINSGRHANAFESQGQLKDRLSTPFVETVDQPPLPVAEPELGREPGATVRLNSGLYVERPPIEAECFAEIEQPGALIRIKAPRQLGKTSLMERVLSHARDQGYKTVSISFQRAESKTCQDLDLLLKWFCHQVGKRFKKHRKLNEYWDVDFDSKENCTSYFEDCLLEELDGPLVLGLDEAERIFPNRQVADDFFGLFRYWHDAARSGDYNSELWENFRLVLVHSTEHYVPLNLHQSPFDNVGKGVELMEFNPEQVQWLAVRYGIGNSDRTAEALMELVGGHPYLIRKALYELRREGLTLKRLVDEAGTVGGIYNDHLKRHLYALRAYPALAEQFHQVVSRRQAVEIRDPDALFKLDSMGLIHQKGKLAWPRCEVYREYFQEHLEG